MDEERAVTVKSHDRLQQAGTVVAIALGLWGAGLSTYQAVHSLEKERPRLYTHLTLSRADYAENAKSRPATFSVKVHNSGHAPVTLLPSVTFLVTNPASGFTRTYDGQFASDSAYSLPKTLNPGEQTSATATTPDSDSVFGINMRYAVALQSADGESYYTTYVSGPMKTPEAYDVLQQHIKYQAKVEFGSKPANLAPAS
uniref:hypothetical protein n=1 Tax=Cupriavidus taiwanensis TaxID=164546 RepID=UPI0011C05940|nr:hypothetical protein [Cupriavidus taiwanensis]